MNQCFQLKTIARQSADVTSICKLCNNVYAAGKQAMFFYFCTSGKTNCILLR